MKLLLPRIKTPTPNLESWSPTALRRLEGSKDFQILKDRNLTIEEREAAARRLVLAGALQSVTIGKEISFLVAQYSPEFVGVIIENWPEQRNSVDRGRLAKEICYMAEKTVHNILM